MEDEALTTALKDMEEYNYDILTDPEINLDEINIGT